MIDRVGATGTVAQQIPYWLLRLSVLTSGKKQASRNPYHHLPGVWIGWQENGNEIATSDAIFRTDNLSSHYKEYEGTDLGIVAISANDATAYAEDAPDSLKAMAAAESFTFPLCYDETQAVAKAYTAACTPDFFLFDQQRTLVYRGQLDASRPGNQIPVTGKDLRAAIEAVLADQPINPVQKPSLGCNIKWKKGHEPAYFLRQ